MERTAVVRSHGGARPGRTPAPARTADPRAVLRRGPGGLAPGDVLRLQRVVGNGATGRLLRALGSAPAAPRVQRMTIAGERIRPYGKNGKVLWDLTRKALFDLGLSPHGARKEFVRVASEDADFRDVGHFLTAFGEAAGAEVERAEQEKHLPKEQRTRAWTRPLKLNRPAWLDLHKSSAQKGEDIRHVVRNANIRNALMAEYRAQMQNGVPVALDAFQRLAGALGLSPEAVHPWELLTRVYDAAYLNPGNLFPGPGAINRVIGLTADELWKRGTKLVSSEEFANAEQIEAIYDEAAQLISAQADATERQADKMSPLVAETFLNGLEDFFDTVTDWLIDREEQFVDRAREQGQQGVFAVGGVAVAEIGREMLDLSANFGFDVPVEAIPQEHMRVLLEVEEYLASYRGDQVDVLTEMLKRFMQLKSILTPAQD